MKRALLLLVLCACSSKAQRVRSLAVERAQGWKLEVQAQRSHDKQEGGLLAPSRDNWPVVVEVRAEKLQTHALLGSPLFLVLGSREAADAMVDGLAVEHCGDGERVLLRLVAKDSDPRWHLFVLSPNAVALQTRALSADTCAAALAAAPAVDDWLRARLTTPVAAYPEVPLVGAVLGQDPSPKARAQMALARVSPLMLAVRERRASVASVDFMLDRLGDFSELLQWKPGSDAYGDYDVLAFERQALEDRLRDDPALLEHVRTRAAPASPVAAAWLAQLKSTAASLAQPSTVPAEPAPPR